MQTGGIRYWPDDPDMPFARPLPPPPEPTRRTVPTDGQGTTRGLARRVIVGAVPGGGLLLWLRDGSAGETGWAAAAARRTPRNARTAAADPRRW